MSSKGKGPTICTFLDIFIQTSSTQGPFIFESIYKGFAAWGVGDFQNKGLRRKGGVEGFLFGKGGIPSLFSCWRRNLVGGSLPRGSKFEEGLEKNHRERPTGGHSFKK